MDDIGMIKGGACLVALARRRGGVDVVDHGGIGSGLGGLPERRGGRNSKYKANIASQSITWQYAVPGVT